MLVLNGVLPCGQGPWTLASVPHAHDRDLDLSVGAPHHHLVPRAALQERTAERRAPGDVAPVEVYLVLSHDPVRRPFAVLVPHLDVCAEKHRVRAIRPRLDHRRTLEALGQPVDATIDLAELFLPVDVFGVLAPVALSGRIGDFLY